MSYHIRFRCYNNIQPPVCLLNIETPPPTPIPNFSQNPPQISQFQTTPHVCEDNPMRIFWREDIVAPFVTTYAIPLRSAYIDLYIINHYCISSTKLQHLRCFQNPPLQQRTHTSIKKHLGDALFPSYFVTPHSSLKWMNNAALEEATNRGVLVNTSQVGNF